MESRTARLAALVTVIGGLAGFALWATAAYAEVKKVPGLELKVDAMLRRQCLIMDKLGIAEKGCYDLPAK